MPNKVHFPILHILLTFRGGLLIRGWHYTGDSKTRSVSHVPCTSLDTKTRSVSHVPCTAHSTRNTKTRGVSHVPGSETRSVSHVPCTSTVLVPEILKRAAFHAFLVLVQY